MEGNPVEYFTSLYGATQAIAIFYLLLLVLWLGVSRGGFGLNDLKTMFNWHPLLMTLGMIFVYGNAILIFRAYRNTKKKTLKIIHTVCHIIGFSLAVCGLKVVFDSHRLATPPIPDVYSLHSWVGLSAVFFYGCQGVAAFIIFLCPGLSMEHRKLYYPVHIFFGTSTFVCANIALVSGLTEKALFSIDKYYTLPKEGILVNCIGYLVLMFSCLVLHLVVEVKYKRQPLPEDQMLLTAAEIRQKKN